MHPPFFPITPKVWSAKTTWNNLKAGTMQIGDLKVDIREVDHRGLTYGFQFLTPEGRKILYVTDHQLNPKSANFAKWIRGADLLIHDTHFDNSRPKSLLWGHTRFEEIAKLSILENVKKIVLFHHNPSVSDKILEKRLKICRNMAKKLKSKTKFWISEEGKTLQI